MAGKHIINVPVVMIYFTSLLLLFAALMISPVDSSSSFSAEYQSLVPTFLPTLRTESETLSRDTQDQQPKYNSNSLSLSLKLHHVDNLIMSSHHQGGKITSESLFIKRLKRDSLRASRVFAITKSRTSASRDFSSPVISGLEWGSGEYFTRIGVGSQPNFFYMVMDTGSDIIWLQCLPCKSFYKQVDPIFDPTNSTSFHGVSCKSKICVETLGYCHNQTKCQYELLYGDGSFSKGEIVTETLTFGKSTEVPNVIIGCGHENEGLLVAAAGLLGLARAKLSFLGQAGRKFGNKFSYCLANRTSYDSSSSYLVFGDSPVCGKALSTSLVENPIRDELNIYYYVGLEGFSVGGSRVHGINASMFRIDRNTGDGGVIVDSGTSVTRLTKHAYLALRDAFRNVTAHLKPASKYSLFDTCYHLSRMKEVQVPTVDLHFAGGANMSLPAANYMIPVDNKMKYCFAFAGTQSDGGLSIIGNIQEQGFGIVFDVANNRLGFAPNAC